MGILGEAAANVSKETRKAHPEIPWRKIVGMRNVLIHGYREVSSDRVWAAVNLLPELEVQLRAILEEAPQ